MQVFTITFYHFTLPVEVIKITFPLVRCLLSFTPMKSYLTICSGENLIFATASGNVSVISYGNLVTIPHLDLLIFH